jgi:preprotein translocase subunit SecD
MEIIEERTIGPSLGAENIAKGFNSVTWGFAAVAVFMCIYYLFFGVISSVSLALNLLLLVAVLSMLQATLTLPGMAAMALVLGMAIDANVLINERVREELRNGASPQAAIHAGYDRAWATIIDSNVTTLIAGLALLAFGSGPVRGFAVVHCLGILTSMFSGVFFSRGVVNLWYGRQKKLKGVSIGTVWRPTQTDPDADLLLTVVPEQTPKWFKWASALVFLLFYNLVVQVISSGTKLSPLVTILVYAPQVFIFFGIVGVKSKKRE